MGSCLSIHNNISIRSYIDVSIFINNKFYNIYSSLTAMNKWCIYLPNYIIDHIYNNNLSYHIIITYSTNNNFYNNIFHINNNIINNNSNLSYFDVKLLYYNNTISKLLISFKT